MLIQFVMVVVTMHSPSLVVFKMKDEPILKGLVGVRYPKAQSLGHENGTIEIICGEIVFIKHDPNLVILTFLLFLPSAFYYPNCIATCS